MSATWEWVVSTALGAALVLIGIMGYRLQRRRDGDVMWEVEQPVGGAGRYVLILRNRGVSKARHATVRLEPPPSRFEGDGGQAPRDVDAGSYIKLSFLFGMGSGPGRVVVTWKRFLSRGQWSAPI